LLENFDLCVKACQVFLLDGRPDVGALQQLEMV
jgi:hypothetical protein